ncbi:MAG: cellulase family glycosylhydrolase [Ruminococcus sp.]|nr:cellulase family glycosylhydrolase [Ruminococcus sp.]
MKRKSALVMVFAMIMSMICSFGASVFAADPKISLVSDTVSVMKGRTAVLEASVTGISDYTLSWSSSDKSVASVNSEGKVKGLKNGTAEITVTIKGTSVSDKATVNVGRTGKTGRKQPVAILSDDLALPDLKSSASETVSHMKIGWNLGNSLDALGSGLSSETVWGNPKTTQKMIDDVIAAGFKTIRIPVSWGRHTDKAGNVDAEWMNRVKEVVDYAYNKDVYVILNSHHDNEYYDIGGCVKDEKVLQQSVTKMTKLWTQISNTFKSYDGKLIFETLNEPRTEGSAKEWTGGTAAEREIVYTLNEKIVEAIRKTGGNNTTRKVMVPCYAATSSTSILKGMKLPDDDNIIVSVHAYSPYNYAMNGDYSGKFSESDMKELDKFFSDLNDIFISKGTPVVIGEFGAVNKSDDADRCKWAEYYVKGAKKYGIPCVWWDNNSGTSKGNECFGLYRRQTGKWVFKDVVDALINAAK